MLRRSVAVLAMLLIAPAGAWAQLTTGTITGVVRDSSGGVVPGATVVVTNDDTGAARSVVTDNEGRYETPNLPVGNYSLRGSLQGFQTTNRTGINLTVGRTAVVDLELKVGDMTESVVVTGEAGLVETRTATVSNLVDAKRVVELPLMNRDLTQLTFLQPGVLKMPTPGAGNSGSFSGMGDKLTVAGARGNQNIFMLDGVSNSDLSGNPQGATGGYAGAETIQEFQIITNNYSAEYQESVRRDHQRSDQIRHQQVPRFLVRVPQERRDGRGELLRQEIRRGEAELRSQSVWRFGGRTDPPQPNVLLHGVRGAAAGSGADIHHHRSNHGGPAGYLADRASHGEPDHDSVL